MSEEELARVLKALADPNRRRILQMLAEKEAAECANSTGGIICSRITEQLTISQPTVSHHMKELVAANLISMTPQGNIAILALRTETLEALIETLQARFVPDKK